MEVFSLLVPAFKFNLLSVRKLAVDSQLYCVFHQYCFMIQDLRTHAIVAAGRVVKDLYILDKNSFSPSSIQDAISMTSTLSPAPADSSPHTILSASLWHSRLGHPSHEVLMHLSSFFPYRVDSLNGCRYFLTLVDDFSRTTWTFLVRFKSQVSSMLFSFTKYTQTQFNRSIKTIRSDNGSEFVNSSCHCLFNDLGIVHQRSCPYTPQQNGVVERKHQHIVQVARSLLYTQIYLPNFGGKPFSLPHILLIVLLLLSLAGKLLINCCSNLILLILP